MTDWTPFTPPSGAPSGLQCVTTWRGSDAGTYPLGVYWAGTDGTLWRSSTDLGGDFAQMGTNTTVVTRIAVDDRETIYGINSAGKPVQYGNDGWTSLDLGDNSEQYVMIDVAVATKDDTVWFVAREGQYYVHGTNITLDGSRSLPLKAVAPIQAPDSSGANSVGQAWGVIGWGGLALSDGNAWVFNDGKDNMISDVADVKASVNYAWLLKTDGSVWATTTGYTGQRAGTLTAKSICGGQADHCFAVGTDGKPYRTTNSTPLA
jgi:hypothetical protein